MFDHHCALGLRGLYSNNTFVYVYLLGFVRVNRRYWFPDKARINVAGVIDNSKNKKRNADFACAYKKNSVDGNHALCTSENKTNPVRERRATAIIIIIL